MQSCNKCQRESPALLDGLCLSCRYAPKAKGLRESLPVFNRLYHAEHGEDEGVRLAVELARDLYCWLVAMRAARAAGRVDIAAKSVSGYFKADGHTYRVHITRVSGKENASCADTSGD
jgi:hypothetical protein